jgi:hypothetical protein
MAITPAERDVLLKRLELARIAKIKKQDEAKAAKAAKAEPVTAPAPAPEPIPIPEPPVLQEIQSPPSEPIPIPDAPKKKAAKKVCLPISSDEEEEEEKPKKKSKTVKKEMPYMKLKIYREPNNPQAFQSLLESIHNPPEYEDEPAPAPAPEPPAPFARPPRVLHSNQKQNIRPMVGADRKFEDARAAAMAFFS